MNKAMVFGSAILLVAVVVGCDSSSPEDETMKEMIRLMNQAADHFEKGDIEGGVKLRAKAGELDTQVKSWPREKQAEMEKKYKAERDAAAERIQIAFLRNIKK